MDRVKTLYFSLSSSEKKALRSYLEAFHQKGENKPVEFLKLIDREPEVSHENSAKQLYGDPKSKAFIMMKSRLFERLMEFTALASNGDSVKRDRDNPYHQDLIEFRRCMLFASALQERQLSGLAFEYLEKARELAARCNTPELEVDVLLRIRGLDRSGTDRFEELSVQIQKALKQQECDINATGLMRKFLTLNGSQIGGNEDRIAFLEAHLPGLEDSIRQVYSARADYFLQMLKVHLCYLNRRFEEGRAYAKRALELLMEYEGIRSPLRMADSWFQLGRLELEDGCFEDALVSLEKARSYQTEESRAYLTISVLLLYCRLHRKEHREAQQLMDHLRNGAAARTLEQSPLNKGIFTYLTACLQFMRGQLQDAWMSILDCQEMNLEKGTWITSIRLFEIMILVDKKELDLASQKLENLRKHISRYQANPRMKAIFKLLMAQDRTGFRFSPVQGEAEQLENLRTQLPWDAIGQEVVRFDEWYQERRAKVLESR
jgi:hypothetical protein